MCGAQKIARFLAFLSCILTTFACRSTSTMADAWPTPSSCKGRVLQASDMYAMDQAPTHTQWLVLSGRDEGDVIDLITTIDANHVVTIDEPQTRITKIQWRADGSCALISVDSVEQGTRSVFNPPLLMCNSELKCDAPLQSESPMQAVLIAGGAPRDSGTGTRTITMDGMSLITTPLGTFDCVVVSARLIGALSHATMECSVTTWIAPELGAIAERYSEKIKILGVFTQQFERVIVKLPKKL